MTNEKTPSPETQRRNALINELRSAPSFLFVEDRAVELMRCAAEEIERLRNDGSAQFVSNLSYEGLLERLGRRANVADDECRTDDADLFREALCSLEKKVEL